MLILSQVCIGVLVDDYYRYHIRQNLMHFFFILLKNGMPAKAAKTLQIRPSTCLSSPPIGCLRSILGHLH